MGKKRDNYLAPACADPELHGDRNGTSLHLPIRLAMPRLFYDAVAEELHLGIYPFRRRRRLQCPRVIQPRVFGRSEANITAPAPRRFCRWENPTSERQQRAPE